jgi:hypothetical protein
VQVNAEREGRALFSKSTRPARRESLPAINAPVGRLSSVAALLRREERSSGAVPFPQEPLLPGHFPRIAQKLPSAALHVLDHQRSQARPARGSAPTPALFIMHKGAQACINRPNLRASGRKSTRLDLPDAPSQHQNRPTSVPSPRGRRLG